ncbi:hypothetical protein WICPIJ_003921 [Wickerhamomyces pijperi]|uniref:Protein YAE1 n=1 Tax=Wickerhamomyces pijperi TaxID=599730 RepID=A0A9P8TNS4_WICPI|nr:hypothetical protein WICPIJ_003921 [Wickerhamomyces pijperi]
MTTSNPTAEHKPDFDDNDDIWGSSSSENDEPYKQQTKNTSNLYSQEDYYGSQSHPTDSPTIQALRRQHSKQGYLAGLSSHKEESLQLGFDEGYPMGAKLGLDIGKILGQLSALSSMNVSLNSGDNDHLKEKIKELLEEVKRECGIKKVLNSKYFDEKLNLKETDTHPVVQKWSKELELILEEVKSIKQKI